MLVPSLVKKSGPDAVDYTLEFFSARISNENTREAYSRAVVRFCVWCEQQNIADLSGIRAPLVAAYQAMLLRDLSVPSARVHLAGIRNWLDWLCTRGVIVSNPSKFVRSPRHIVVEGKAPVLTNEQAQRLLASIGGHNVIDLRDRALISVMLFSYARVGAVLKMRVRDFEDGGGGWLHLIEKRGVTRRLPAHHEVRDVLRAYLAEAQLASDSSAPLFQSRDRWSRKLNGQPLSRKAALRIVKRRARVAGLPSTLCNHSFRATGMTLHGEAGGDIRAAARIAGHSKLTTTALYVRSSVERCMREEIELVRL